jgi:release factor glutamine methyltransferase
LTPKAPEAPLLQSPVCSETVAEALRHAAAVLDHSESPLLDSQLLLAHVLKTTRASLLAHEDDLLDAKRAAAFRELVERRASGLPVAYLRGFVEWFGLTLKVTPDVLVPRPETEHLVDQALTVACSRSVREIVDVGTGSGAISVALGLRLPDATITAIDASAAALDVAFDNVRRHGLGDRIELRHGNLLEPATVEPDLIVANLPYLSDCMMSRLPVDVTHEPQVALRAGPTGLERYAELFGQIASRRWSTPTVIEIDSSQSASITELIHRHFPAATIEITCDYAGRDRVVTFLHRASARD